MEFDIIEYLSGLTTYVFDKAVLKRIALERGVLEVRSFGDIDEKTRDLLYADLLFTEYISPDTTSSFTNQHGAFSKTIGSQTLRSKKGIYNIMVSIYKKWNDKKLESISSQVGGGLRWLE